MQLKTTLGVKLNKQYTNSGGGKVDLFWKPQLGKQVLECT